MVMPRGDRTGPTGSGPMTGRGMGPCARAGKGGSFLRKGGGLGLLGLATWLIKLWSSGRQPAVVSSGAKEDEAEDLRKKIAELEGTLSELKQQLDKVKSDKSQALH
jgi:hypothetical protein